MRSSGIQQSTQDKFIRCGLHLLYGINVIPEVPSWKQYNSGGRSY
ncbi:MAG: hypothetical protein ACXAD7_21945 [Candidatus Kariarchaeaceae archaeon]